MQRSSKIVVRAGFVRIKVIWQGGLLSRTHEHGTGQRKSLHCRLSLPPRRHDTGKASAARVLGLGNDVSRHAMETLFALQPQYD